MKKILIVDACVREEASRTRILLEKAVETLAGLHPDWEFETLELQKLGISWLGRESLAERDRLLQEKNTEHPRFRFAHRFREADGIIVAAPFWDLSYPAILKVFIENVSVDGLTFFCDEEGLHGLCRAEWMLHLVTRGVIWEKEMCQDSAYLETRCRFFGIGAYRCVSADGIDIVGLDHEQIMKDALEETAKVCREL